MGSTLIVAIVVVVAVAIALLVFRGRGKGGSSSSGPHARRWSWSGSGGASRSVTVAMAMNDDYATAAVSRAADATRGDLPRALREVTLALSRERPAVTRAAFANGAKIDAAPPTGAPPPAKEQYVTLTAVYSGPAVEPPVDGETLSAIFTTIGALRETELSSLNLTVGGAE